MEILTDILIRDGISSTLIVVLIFIWRDISRISRKVDSFSRRLYHKDGQPIYQSVEECGEEMAVCRKDINNIGTKVHKLSNDMARIEMQLAALCEQLNRKGK